MVHKKHKNNPYNIVRIFGIIFTCSVVNGVVFYSTKKAWQTTNIIIICISYTYIQLKSNRRAVSTVKMSDSETSSSSSSTPQESNNIILVNILEEYKIIFNKSQVPNIKDKKEKAYKDIHRKYVLQSGNNVNEKQVKKKINNMKSELKKRLIRRSREIKKLI